MKGTDKVRRAMMAEGNDMDEEVKVKEEEGCSRGDKREQPFVLLLRVTQASGKPCCMTPREVVILTDQEVMVELEMETPILEVSRAVHGLYQWAGQSMYMDSLVARKDSIKEIVRE